MQAHLYYSTKAIVAIVASVAIVFAVMSMKNVFGEITMDNKKLFAGLFALGWLALGVSVGMGKSSLLNKNTYLGVSGAILVLLSMLKMLPKQRELCVVNGPGMPMFALGWVAVVLGNSLIE